MRGLSSWGWVGVALAVAAPGIALAGPPAGYRVATPRPSVARDAERNVDQRCIFLSGCRSQDRHRQELDGAVRLERADVPLSAIPEAAVTIVPPGTIRILEDDRGAGSSDIDPAHRGDAVAYDRAKVFLGMNFAFEDAFDRFSVHPGSGEPTEATASPFRFVALGPKQTDGRLSFDLVEGVTNETFPYRVRRWSHADGIEIGSGLFAIQRRSAKHGRRLVAFAGLLDVELPVDLLAPNAEGDAFDDVRDRMDRTDVFAQVAFLGEREQRTILDVYTLSDDPNPVVRWRVRR